MGNGAYGQVALCLDDKGNKVAIKKLNKIEDAVDAKRVLREIRILKYLDHENISKLLNVFHTKIEGKDIGEIYLVMNYMEIDLYKVIRSG